MSKDKDRPHLGSLVNRPFPSIELTNEHYYDSIKNEVRRNKSTHQYQDLKNNRCIEDKAKRLEIMEIEQTERKGLYIGGAQHKFDLSREEDFIEVTRWHNGEGYTISLSTAIGARTFEMSWEELEGIKYLINRLEND